MALKLSVKAFVEAFNNEEAPSANIVKITVEYCRHQYLAADSRAQVSLGVSQERPEVSRKNISPPSWELGILNLSSSSFLWQTGPRVWGFLVEDMNHVSHHRVNTNLRSVYNPSLVMIEYGSKLSFTVFSSPEPPIRTDNITVSMVIKMHTASSSVLRIINAIGSDCD